jgi:DUF1680 family protein
MKINRIATVLTLPLFLAAADLPATGAPKIMVQDKAICTLKSFPLQDVKLLQGPFETARELNAKYLLTLSADRLLHNFHLNAGLPTKGSIYGGWENRGVAGHMLGHVLSALAMEYEATGDKRFKERIDYLVSELARCQDATGTGYVAGIPDGNRVWDEIKKGDVRASGFDLNGGWVPWYTLHKLFAGLRDAYEMGGNTQAKTVLVKLSDWAIDVTSDLDETKWQQMLQCEHGGMNEVLADVYALTGEAKYLELAKKFDHKFVLDPLRAGEDKLAGLHGNTQIPKVIGLARLYELSGQQDDRKAAEFFWDRIVKTRTFAIGGNSEHEHLSGPNEISNHLGTTSAESCNTYNMLKLTRHLYSWTGDAGYFDFYERALYNHILASQDPEQGMFTYFVSLKPGSFKTFSSPDDSFWCCVGSGVENHTKYNEAIYAHDESSLYVNLFIPSQVNWREKGLAVRQETRFPAGGTTDLQVVSDRPVKATIKVRVPQWSAATVFKINGKVQKVAAAPKSYASFAREWKRGDVLEVAFEMKVRAEPAPDDASKVALLYGPIVLAAQLGKEGLPNQRVPDHMELFGVPTIAVPVLVAKDGVAAHVKPVAGQDLRFRIGDIGRRPGVDNAVPVSLAPFYQTSFERYTVYFDAFSPAQWAGKEAEYEAEQRKIKDLVARTVDEYRPGEQQSEVDHAMKGERTRTGSFDGMFWRDANDGGYFEFTMKVAPGATQDLQLTYWGNDKVGRNFDVLVDGVVVGSESLNAEKPGAFVERNYALPAALLNGKESVVVRLQAKVGAIAGGVFGGRILRR